MVMVVYINTLKKQRIKRIILKEHTLDNGKIFFAAQGLFSEQVHEGLAFLLPASIPLLLLKVHASKSGLSLADIC